MEMIKKDGINSTYIPVQAYASAYRLTLTKIFLSSKN